LSIGFNVPLNTL